MSRSMVAMYIGTETDLYSNISQDNAKSGGRRDQVKVQEMGSNYEFII